VRNQEAEILSLNGQLEELAVTRREILPLMQRMVDTLEQVVAADLPFLPVERRARVEALKALLEDPEASLPDQFRRLLEAYQVASAPSTSTARHARWRSCGWGAWPSSSAPWTAAG